MVPAALVVLDPVDVSVGKAFMVEEGFIQDFNGLVNLVSCSNGLLHVLVVGFLGKSCHEFILDLWVQADGFDESSAFFIDFLDGWLGLWVWSPWGIFQRSGLVNRNCPLHWWGRWARPST